MSRNVHVEFSVVVIGRNEGSRLAKCLDSVLTLEVPAVYVDSGSRDESVELARGRGMDVLELSGGPYTFSAARARNAGAAYVREHFPETEFVQFVDGDCELSPRWPALAMKRFREEPGLGICCGMKREIYPHASVYNLLCDIEWNGPLVDSGVCGGDMMVRMTLFEELSGFNDGLIAGEEPDLCFRAGSAGWTCRRLRVDMTMHDAAIHSFRQWWARSVRSGHAFAEVSDLHRRLGGEQWQRERYSIVFWGVLIPVFTVAMTVLVSTWFLCLSGIYVAQVIRIYLRLRSLELDGRSSIAYAAFCMVGKFPQAIGLTRYYFRRMFGGGRSKLLEYKTVNRN